MDSSHYSYTSLNLELSEVPIVKANDFERQIAQRWLEFALTLMLMAYVDKVTKIVDQLEYVTWRRYFYELGTRIIRCWFEGLINVFILLGYLWAKEVWWYGYSASESRLVIGLYDLSYEVLWDTGELCAILLAMRILRFHKQN